MTPQKLHLKLFCDGGEFYLDVDVPAQRITVVEKDPEFRPALLRALLPLVHSTADPDEIAAIRTATG